MIHPSNLLVCCCIATGEVFTVRDVGNLDYLTVDQMRGLSGLEIRQLVGRLRSQYTPNGCTPPQARRAVTVEYLTPLEFRERRRQYIREQFKQVPCFKLPKRLL